MSVDTTVQEKNITYPTDAKLHRKIVNKCKSIVGKEDLAIRQSYTRILKKPGINRRFRNHPKNKGKALKADRKIKTIAGRLVREIERNLPNGHLYEEDIAIFNKVLAKKKSDQAKFMRCMSLMHNVFSKVRDIKSRSLGTRFLLFIPKIQV